MTILRQIATLPIRALRKLRRAFPPFLPPEASPSFSQEGEDMILRWVFGWKSNGYYVDVGAHHPWKYSNTAYLYGLGWGGLNIEPNPAVQPAFARYRPRDKNLCLAVGATDSTLTYFMFGEAGINTCSEEQMRAYVADGKVVSDTRQVPCRPLAAILGEHLPADQGIDLLSVDVEGLDLDVLRSNDWAKYRPAVVLCEDIRAEDIDAVAHSPVAQFLRQVGYKPIAKTRLTIVFRCNEPSGR